MDRRTVDFFPLRIDRIIRRQDFLERPIVKRQPRPQPRGLVLLISAMAFQIQPHPTEIIVLKIAKFSLRIRRKLAKTTNISMEARTIRAIFNFRCFLKKITNFVLGFRTFASSYFASTFLCEKNLPKFSPLPMTDIWILLCEV